MSIVNTGKKYMKKSPHLPGGEPKPPEKHRLFKNKSLEIIDGSYRGDLRQKIWRNPRQAEAS